MVAALDQDKIINTTANRSIKWTFNPPQPPHVGGVFELMVKSANFSIRAILENANVADAELHSRGVVNKLMPHHSAQ
jgi:hypothetical protein